MTADRPRTPDDPTPARAVADARVRPPCPRPTVWKGTVVALVVFVVLASGNMVSSARGMPLGWQRTVAVAVSRGRSTGWRTCSR